MQLRAGLTDHRTIIVNPARTGFQEADVAGLEPRHRTNEPVGVLACGMAPRSHVASCMLRIKNWGLRALQARTQLRESCVQEADAARSSDLTAPQARMLGAGIPRGDTNASPGSS